MLRGLTAGHDLVQAPKRPTDPTRGGCPPGPATVCAARRCGVRSSLSGQHRELYARRSRTVKSRRRDPRHLGPQRRGPL